MPKQTIESTKAIQFLDERILLAKGSAKKDKISALERARQVIYNYYLTQDEFIPEESAEGDDLFGVAGAEEMFL